ncbi:hypothetical protein Ccrd_012293 [Cynara cardunculus var. scolymus]|uniref:Ovarian tumor, otubain n=1 Tax=Cynara cardunculus var. scolymus TaxID=59895 RepID=A0A103YHT6_CYNCS|nr:hypothetical protein Ccrd_012293 [Cynara cardunculus var. scolymus]
MFTHGQDPDVVRWGLQLFDGGPFNDSSYSGYGSQNYADCYHDQYSRETSYDTQCINPENDKHLMLALPEDGSSFSVAEASAPSCEEVDLSQTSFYLPDSLNQSMANYSLGDDENTNDLPPTSSCGSPTRQLNYGEEWSYSLDLSDEYALDDEVGKRLNQLASIPHVPRVNGEIPSVDEATLDHQRLIDSLLVKRCLNTSFFYRLQLYQLVESKVQGDGNCQANTLNLHADGQDIFRALSDQVYRTAEHHKFVRQQIVNQVGSVNGAIMSLCRLLLIWYGSASLTYGIKVFVITSFKDTCYIEIVPSVQRSNRVIFLSFWAEVHYNSIYPVEDLPPMRG